MPVMPSQDYSHLLFNLQLVFLASSFLISLQIRWKEKGKETNISCSCWPSFFLLGWMHSIGKNGGQIEYQLPLLPENIRTNYHHFMIPETLDWFRIKRTFFNTLKSRYVYLCVCACVYHFTAVLLNKRLVSK